MTTIVTPILVPATQTVVKSTAIDLVCDVTPASAAGVGFRGTVQWAVDGRSFASSPVVYDAATDAARARLTMRAPAVVGTHLVTAHLISGDTRFVPVGPPANPARGDLIVTAS